MRLLSDLYNVTLKRGIRGKAGLGFVRPTIGENFMTHRDFQEVVKIIYGPDLLDPYKPEGKNLWVPTSAVGAGPDKLIDGLLNTSWQTISQGAFIIVRFDYGLSVDANAKIVEKYNLAARSTAPAESAPISWTFEGSHADYDNWDLLDTHTNDTILSDNKGSIIEFEISNSTPYSWYRVGSISNGGYSSTHVGELSLYEKI